MTKPAQQHLKEVFPDLNEKEMDKMVQVMKEYAREVGEDTRTRCSQNAVAHIEIIESWHFPAEPVAVVDYKAIQFTEILTP